MTVDDLREILEDLPGDMVVMMAHQPTYPLQFTVGDAVSVEVDGEPRLYIGEGTQPYDAPYLAAEAAEALGW